MQLLTSRTNLSQMPITSLPNDYSVMNHSFGQDRKLTREPMSFYSQENEINSSQISATLVQSDYSALNRRLEEKKGLMEETSPFYFRGELLAGDFNFSTQRFSLREENDKVFIENYSKAFFPKIEIVLRKENNKTILEEFNLRPLDNSVQSEVFYTRMFLLISKFHKCSLSFVGVDAPPLNFNFPDLPVASEKQALFSAKLYRKLRFLEKNFNTKFNLPKEISAQETAQIEILFRAVTEGEFFNPTGSSITVFNYKIGEEDLQNISIAQRREFSFEFDEDLLVLGRFFPIGKMRFKLEKASIANPRVLRNHVEEDVLPTLRLNVFDHQVHHYFEKYSNSERLLKNRRRLEQFKNALRKEEPDFLVNLLDEPLAEINDKSAIEIVEGLLQYYDFPDRFSILEPSLKKNQWRVPIALTYPKYEPIWLADAFVDVRTGKVEMKNSFDELLKKGKKKAKEVFSIA